MDNNEENNKGQDKREIELLKKEILRLKEENSNSSKREKEALNMANEASKREKEAINIANEAFDKMKKMENQYKNYKNLSRNSLNKLENSEIFKEGNRAEKLRKDIDKYIKTLSIEERQRIEGLQKYLTKLDNNYKFEDNKIKMSFSYTFGDKIDNKKFVSFIEQGLSNLYSSDKEISKNVFKFFQDIEKEIKNFIYIPMLDENSLCELKKHLYLGALTSHLEEDDYQAISRYIFYDDEYFNESNFEEICFNITRDDSFIKSFPEYEKKHTFKFNLENIKEYIFSQAIKEAYLETCRDIFGKDANFVNEKNIESILDDIYEKIIKKNMKIVRLEKGFFGVTIFSKKILISNSFIININNSVKYEMRVTFLAGLLKTILHEIMHCLTNSLPSLSTDYNELCNPFIRTFQKNIKVYNYVMGKSVYPGAKNYLEILHNKIENYEFISDSGTHFEEKLFGKDSKMNYFNSEFFLNVENLNQPLKDFKEKLKDFGTKINESNEFKELRDKTSVSFKSFNNSFYFGNCLLDPKKPLFMN